MEGSGHEPSSCRYTTSACTVFLQVSKANHSHNEILVRVGGSNSAKSIWPTLDRRALQGELPVRSPHLAHVCTWDRDFVLSVAPEVQMSHDRPKLYQATQQVDRVACYSQRRCGPNTYKVLPVQLNQDLSMELNNVNSHLCFMKLKYGGIYAPRTRGRGPSPRAAPSAPPRSRPSPRCRSAAPRPRPAGGRCWRTPHRGRCRG